MNEEHHLGHRALLVIMLQRVGAGVAIFVVTVLLYYFGDDILSLMVSGGNVASIDLSAITSAYMTMLNILFLLSAVAVAFGLLWSLLEFINYTYTFQEFDLKVKRGILRKEEISIPYRQMQDVNLVRDIVYIIMGLSQLVINSAGREQRGEENETNIVLKPIEKDKAEEIRNFLERRIGIQITEDRDMADKETPKTSQA